MNSKFVFVEKHIRTQIEDVYHDVIAQMCNLERQMLQTTLAMARLSPDEFAYNLMGGPGYMAIIAGEVAHIAQCIPVELKIVRKTECYNELPVEIGNFSFHLSPRTHILLKSGTEISCNRLLAPMYLLDGEWYSFGPVGIPVKAPTILKPFTKPTWEYVSPYSLATSGIYTQKELEELRDHLMFPAERPAILNSIARGITGQHTTLQGGSISNLLDEEALHKIEPAWDRTWGYVIKFGNISAGMIGIMILFKAIKLIVDTIIHGYALHTVYGWSLFLIGAIWDSVTHLLLHLSKKPPGPGDKKAKKANKNRKEETIELLPPPSYETYLRPESSSRDSSPEIKFRFDTGIHNPEEYVRQPSTSFHPTTKQGTTPIYSIPRSVPVVVNTPTREVEVYDTVPEPRPVPTLRRCYPTQVAPRPTSTGLYPDIDAETKEAMERSEGSTTTPKETYFLVRKQPQDSDA